MRFSFSLWGWFYFGAGAQYSTMILARALGLTVFQLTLALDIILS